MPAQWEIGEIGREYLDFIWQCLSSTEEFAKFRQNSKYTRILEHVSQHHGIEYLKCIENATIKNICFSSEYADTIGSPEVFDYNGHLISPTTLRYGKVLQDLIENFPDFDNFDNIIEIGVGYGGQARLVSEYVMRTGAKLKTYCLLDQWPVLQLSRQYLEHFALSFEIKYITKSELPSSSKFDLAISNYAFSEFSRALQKEYLTKIFLNSLAGYLTMNSGLHAENVSQIFSIDELLGVLPNSVVMNETPRTGPSNYLLIFGRHQSARPSTVESIREAAES